jgi:dethiobiotin synthetase
MSAIFVTATGTDIGKTFVAAGLIRHVRRAGGHVHAIKPVLAGFDPAAAEASDAGVLLAALGQPVTLSEIERISPWRYTAPLSPDMAARRERRAVEFDALVQFCRHTARASPGLLLIEGIGGAMVPLDDRHTVLDWIAALEVPSVIVTGSYLGSLSHTLTCLDVFDRRHLAIKALVVNETPGSTIGIHDTAEIVARFAAPVPVIELPRLLADGAGHPAFDAIARLL